MLKKIAKTTSRGRGGVYAIVASRYNGKYVDAMLRAAMNELKRGGADGVRVVRVPGAFEIPAVASALAQEDLSDGSRSHGASRFAAILCFGVIFQGQTSHAQHIGWGVTHALAQIQVQHQMPVVHAVFTFEKEEHARVRCLGKKHNRGIEAARTALEMAKVMRIIDGGFAAQHAA